MELFDYKDYLKYNPDLNNYGITNETDSYSNILLINN